MSSKLATNDDHLQEPPILMTSLPDEILLDCVARLPRSYYPILSLVSKQFRSLVTSPELYRRRCFLGYEEHCLYVAISENIETSNIHWYTLARKPNDKLWLVRIPSLPPMPLHGSYVVKGSSIYVMGGFHQWQRGLITPNVSRLDCVSHMAEPLTRMPKAVAASVSALVDGKVYVIGALEGPLLVPGS
ncbi:F-box/kelch-repeat protein At4g38940 [Arabidopsis lyrata subsp. lyrata]|uniref:F-box/kelch-repeat protein At4g38940 n=1 Tax=Arabidopsis lyrata subsp. lyrata TaxID=81972 RepID=UPI000A29C455|nr:F-box/kelch-repeat protein At4g38940 [Arabidopsis lyrata subsp. lyrata]|eukprot:XP_020884728.1 F-box/kelch-repeat protein At4g38940 [Arabidopsis lyrata subsp. lyrata]